VAAQKIMSDKYNEEFASTPEGAVFQPVPGSDGLILNAAGQLWSGRRGNRYGRKAASDWRPVAYRLYYGRWYAGATNADRCLMRMMCLTFLGPPNGKIAAFKVPSNKSDHSIRNVCYITNEERKQRNFLVCKGMSLGRRLLTPEDVVVIRNQLRAGERVSDLARRFGVETGSIKAAARGQTFRDANHLSPPLTDLEWASVTPGVRGIPRNNPFTNDQIHRIRLAWRASPLDLRSIVEHYHGPQSDAVHRSVYDFIWLWEKQHGK